MKKRATNKETSKNIQKLEQLLRGTEYRSYEYLKSNLGFELRSLQRYLDSLDPKKSNKKNSDNLIQHRIRKDKNGKSIKEFRIFDPATSTIPNFSEEEITTIWSNVFDNKSVVLEPQIKKKLIKIIGLKIEPPKYKDLITAFRDAIESNKIVLLEEYFSRDLNNEKNLRIVPVYLDIEDRKVYAVELKKNSLLQNIFPQNVLRPFKFENIYGLKLTDIKAEQLTWKSEKEDKDIFGFPSTGNKIRVHIEFDSFVRSQLIRQFPKLEPYPISVGNSKNRFEFKIIVYDIAPIGRFIFGLISRIKILGNKEFKSKLEDYYDNYIKSGILSFKK
jgi:hypothetical protein